MLVCLVISNEYEVASHIIKSLLRKGLISQKEYDRIDGENRRIIIGEAAAK